MALATSNLKDRLAEALTITTSILLGFAIDAWWDRVQEANLDRAHLISVLRELETTSTLLDDAIRLHALTMDRAETVLEMTSKGELVGPPQELDGLINDRLNSYLINAPTGALRAATLSGTIARIQDQALKSLLLGWEGLIDDLLEEEINGFENAAIFTRWLASAHQYMDRHPSWTRRYRAKRWAYERITPCLLPGIRWLSRCFWMIWHLTLPRSA